MRLLLFFTLIFTLPINTTQATSDLQMHLADMPTQSGQGFRGTLVDPFDNKGVPLEGAAFLSEEFYTGANESDDSFIGNPIESVSLIPGAGTSQAAIDTTLNKTLPGEPLPLNDRSFVQIFLPFVFTLCGQDFTSVFVNVDGNLSFGRNGLVAFRLLPEFLAGPPRIAGLWKDLDPEQGGSVSFTTGPDRFSVHWLNVPESVQGGANSFTITLKRKLRGGPFGNAFSVTYGGLTADAGISGYSCGGKVTSRVETSSDLSTEAPFIFKSLYKTAVFEDFTRAGSASDLTDRTLFYPGTRRFRDRFEPNNTFSSARRIHLPFNSQDDRRYTAISPRGDDVDYYRFHARAGQSVVVEFLSSSFIPVLGVFDPSGNRVAFKEPLGVPTRLAYEIPATDTYTLAIGAAPDTEFTGDGLGDGRYVMEVFTIEGRVLSLRDDSTEEVELDFSFPFQGQNWDSVFVNSNGNLTFGRGDLSSSSISGLLNGPPRIAPFWDDLDHGTGGLVTVNALSTTASVTFSDVPVFPLTRPTNTFTVTIYADGSIVFDYDKLDNVTTFRVVGISEGGGVADPGPTDLSEATTLPASGTVYEEFNFEVALDLEDTLIIFD